MTGYKRFISNWTELFEDAVVQTSEVRRVED
jgi:hypothetical protein